MAIEGPSCEYFDDENFPLNCAVDYSKAYCCLTNDFIGNNTGFINCTGNINCTGAAAGTCTVGTATCGMSFPTCNKADNQPMLKTALSGTAMAPWAKIAFQEFCDTFESPDKTATTIITMGNLSEPFAKVDEDGNSIGAKCDAIIKEFQYGWGTVNQGNRVRIKILDQKGATFQRWVERMATNPEGDSTPIKGKYRMKVQFGWYTSGGSDTDVCGQDAKPVETQNDGFLPIPPGFNSAWIICSPVMYFLTDWINVHYEQGKFIYELEGTDTLVRGQEFMIKQIFGKDRKNMYFTKACQLLGTISFPQFRVEFKALDANGLVKPLEFAPRDTPSNGKDRLKITDDTDCQGYGPYDKWYPDTRPPLAIIHEWIKQGVFAKDLTGKVTASGGKVGITLNYDPTYKYKPDEDEWVKAGLPQCQAGGCKDDANEGTIPNYGRLILWQNSIPYCQGNFEEPILNARMKAVYIVNGGNCLNGYSTVLTENGWQRINKLVKFNYNGKVACVDEGGSITWSKVTNWYRNNLNKNKLVKVHLHNSRQRAASISGAIFTEDHPILTDKGYIEVKDLKVTDHLIHSGTYRPSQEVHEAVIGMMLGDGDVKIASNSFNCGHCWKQKFYAEHKAKLLESQIKEVDKGKYPKVKIRNNASPYWRSIAKLFYRDGRKTITENNLKDFTVISLAYLYMDDGSINKKGLAEIATCGFKPQEVDILINKIKSLGISCYRRPNAKWPRIYFGRVGTNELMEKISSYILKEFDYKIYENLRLENKKQINIIKRPFYDTFDLIRCQELENKTKYVYCIDVEKYHNFITHSGVVHNCSPVLQFAPSFRWHSMAAQRTGGILNPNKGTVRGQTEGSVRTGCSIASGNGPVKVNVVTRNGMIQKVNNADLTTMEATYHHIMTNLMIGAIEADLRVQGDPSRWLCSPIDGYGRCVGIIFINPWFLVDGGQECPDWAVGDPDSDDPQFKSACNQLLTNKGWFVLGADHQIKDGQYITTLKLKLIAPGAEINPATNPPTSLGGWTPGDPLPYGGQFGCLERFLIGNTGTAWGAVDETACPLNFIGGGTGCSADYDTVPTPPPD